MDKSICGRTRSTLGVDFFIQNVKVSATRTVTLQLWDTAGEERFRSIANTYFRRADGVVLMYDVMNTSSFINVRDWMESIKICAPDKTPVILCANKVDLRSRGKVKS